MIIIFVFIVLYVLTIDRKIFLHLLILYYTKNHIRNDKAWIPKKRKRFLIQDSYAARVPEKYRHVVDLQKRVRQGYAITHKFDLRV